MRIRPKARDANEKAIVAALIAHGAVVTKLNDAGVPDLLVGYVGHVLLLEVKLPTGPRGGTKHDAGGSARVGQGGNGVLSEAQVKWWSAWTGGNAHVVRTPDDALALLRAIDDSLGALPTTGNNATQEAL